MSSVSFLKKLRDALPEIGVIVFALFFMLSILTFFYLLMGWLNLVVNLPSIENNPFALDYQADGPDADNDLLPDLIENAPTGQSVFVPGREELLGRGTNTNPNNKDSDRDLFTDAIEDKLGTDPNNWFSPGIVWIIWIIALGIAIYFKFIYKPDRLKEYIRNEEDISQSVTGKGTKFAYGGRTIFTKPPEEMTAEEKQAVVSSDSRFQQLTNYSDPRPSRIKKSKIWKLLIQGAIFVIIMFFGLYPVLSN